MDPSHPFSRFGTGQFCNCNETWIAFKILCIVCSLSSSTKDDFGNWCPKVGKAIISTEGGIDGNPASGYHQGHFYTVTLIQSVEYLSNSYLPEMGERKGKVFNNSKQRGCSKASIQTNTKQLHGTPWWTLVGSQTSPRFNSWPELYQF